MWALIAWIGLQPWGVLAKVIFFAAFLLLTAGIVGWLTGSQVLPHLVGLLH
jgi:hypothetical protein